MHHLKYNASSSSAESQRLLHLFNYVILIEISNNRSSSLSKEKLATAGKLFLLR